MASGKARNKEVRRAKRAKRNLALKPQIMKVPIGLVPSTLPETNIVPENEWLEY